MKDYIVEHHIDIVALTETWLSHDDKAEINVLTAGGYNLCHPPRRNRRGGGVGLPFKSTFNMISETPLPTDTFEGMSVTLQCPETNSNVRVYVIYRHCCPVTYWMIWVLLLVQPQHTRMNRSYVVTFMFTTVTSTQSARSISLFL